MLVGQALIVTVLSSLFLFMPSVNGSYWLLTALAAQLYMLMYLMMFVAAIKLRVKAPDHPRAFRIPGGLLGMLTVAGIGMVGVLTTLVVSFIPPEGIDIGSVSRYESTLIIGLLLMCSPPFISSWLRARRESQVIADPI
jgi:amino acid transporter